MKQPAATLPELWWIFFVHDLFFNLSGNLEYLNRTAMSGWLDEQNMMEKHGKKTAICFFSDVLDKPILFGQYFEEYDEAWIFQDLWGKKLV